MMSRIRTIHDCAKLKMMYGTLLLAFAIFMTFNSSGMAYSQQDQGQQTFFESAVNAANQSAASPMTGGQVQEPSEAQGGPLAERTTLSSGIEPELDENFIWSGLISSNIDELPTAEGDPQSAVILPLRDDGALYVGGLTYQSNSPVGVVVWNVANLNNSTSVPEEFGEIGDIGMVQGRAVIPTEIASGTSGSVPFIGNVLELVGDEDEPFIATYAIDAVAGKPIVTGNLTFSDQGLNESE